MKKYFAQLRPLERRLVVGVAVVVVIVLNWAFIWPYFGSLGKYQNERKDAVAQLKMYQDTVARIPELKNALNEYETNGDIVAPQDQGINLMTTIQAQSSQCGVGLQSASPTITHTNDAFFIEQEENINVLATEDNLVSFLYKLGSGSSMIRVRDLSLQPDPPRQQLSANIRLVASYQKTSTATAAHTATAPSK